jgi:putative FmdB family regulatory protein
MSKLLLFDFVCNNCSEKFERLVDSQIKDTLCPSCGNTASRIISPVRTRLDGTDPAFPGEYMKWPKKREEKLKQEQKQASKNS